MPEPRQLQHPARTQAGSHPAQSTSPRPEPTPAPHVPSLTSGLMEAQEASPEDEAARLVSEEISEALTYTDPKGQSFRCTLHSKIMNADERAAADRFAGTLAGGVPWANLPTGAQHRFAALARCRYQLRDMPKWLSVALAEDEVLLFTVYHWLAEHDSTFFRPNLGASQGEAIKPRVVLGA